MERERMEKKKKKAREMHKVKKGKRTDENKGRGKN